MPEAPTGYPPGFADYPAIGSAEILDREDRSEFSWGAGNVPPGLEDAPPAEGGAYRGTTPPIDPQVGVARDI